MFYADDDVRAWYEALPKSVSGSKVINDLIREGIEKPKNKLLESLETFYPPERITTWSTELPTRESQAVQEIKQRLSIIEKQVRELMQFKKNYDLFI